MTYSVDGRGLVRVNDGPVLLLSKSEDQAFKSKVVDRWTSLATTASKKYGVPLSWILSIIFVESRGNPNAINAEVPPGVGLMQITDMGLKRGLSNAQLMDPATNIDIGVAFLSRIVKLGNKDLPRVASYYNCGGRSDGSPHTAPTSGQNPAWGLCATAGYLEGVTAANNTYLTEYVRNGSKSSFQFVPALAAAGIVFVGTSYLLKAIK